MKRLVAIIILSLVSFSDLPRIWANEEWATFLAMCAAWIASHPYLVPIFAAMIPGYIAWIALRTNAAVNLRNKRADVILHCNTRYDQLYEKRGMLGFGAFISDGAHSDFSGLQVQYKENWNNIEAYFRRYWGLQSDQLDYWFAGYVDPETMSSWLMSISDSIVKYRINKSDYYLAYAFFLNDMRKSNEVVNQRLIDVVNFIEEYASRINDRQEMYSAIIHFIRIVERDERVLVADLSRDHHGRFKMTEFSRTLRSEYRRSYVKMSPPGIGSFFRRMIWPIVQFCRDAVQLARETGTGESVKDYKIFLEKKYNIDKNVD